MKNSVGLHNSAKKKVTMKGIKIPRMCIWILGYFHAKRGVISQENGQVSSPYIERKQKDFASYCARMYKVTARILRELRIQRCQVQDKMMGLEEMIAELQGQLWKEVPESIGEKRQDAAFRGKIENLKEEKQALMQELKKIKIFIEDSEHESEELIYETKSRAEALLVTYLEGAKCMTGAQRTNLQQDEVSETLYQQYCRNFKYMLEEEKEENAYAVR